MKRLLFLALALIALTATPAYSCSCFEESGSTREQVISADRSAAFVGVVRITATRVMIEMHDQEGRYHGLRESTAPSAYPEMPYDVSYLVASFEPVHVWKGRDLQPAEVATGTGIGDCGLPFKAGQLVLLYAHAEDYTKLMRASSCGRSSLFSEAEQDIDVLSSKYRSRPPSASLNTSRPVSTGKKMALRQPPPNKGFHATSRSLLAQITRRA